VGVLPVTGSQAFSLGGSGDYVVYSGGSARFLPYWHLYLFWKTLLISNFSRIIPSLPRGAPLSPAERLRPSLLLRPIPQFFLSLATVLPSRHQAVLSSRGGRRGGGEPEPSSLSRGNTVMGEARLAIAS
jgi:hypothetical protein